VAPPNAKSRAALVAVGGVAAASLSQQFQVLLAREVTMRRRMPILVQAILMRNVVLGLLLGLVREAESTSKHTRVWRVLGFT